MLVERPARRGDLLLARTRTNLLALVDLPATAIGEYHPVLLTGTTGCDVHRAHRASSPGRPMIQNLVEERVVAAYDALRGNFPEFCGCEICRATCWSMP